MQVLRAKLKGGGVSFPQFADPVFDGIEVTVIYDTSPQDDRGWEIRETAHLLKALGKKAEQVIFEVVPGRHVRVMLPIYTDGSSTSWFLKLKPKTYRTIKAALAKDAEQIDGLQVMWIECATMPRDEYGEERKKPALEQLAVDTAKRIAKAAGHALFLPLAKARRDVGGDVYDFYWAGPAKLK